MGSIRPGVKCEDIKDKLTQFLQVRGLNIKESKTRVVSPQEGFDFLGWNFAVKPNGKFIRKQGRYDREETNSIMKKAQQNYKCKACELSFLSGDKVELHHKDGNHANWKKSNLEAL